MAIIAQMCDLVYVMYAGRIVESGTVEQIFYSPAHPYTQGLLGSISYKNHKKKLPTIAGTVPALTDKTKGCPFFARFITIERITTLMPGQIPPHVTMPATTLSASK